MTRYTPPGTSTNTSAGTDGPTAFELKRRRRLRIVAVIVCISFVLPVVATVITAMP